MAGKYIAYIRTDVRIEFERKEGDKRDLREIAVESLPRPKNGQKFSYDGYKVIEVISEGDPNWTATA